MLTGIFNFLFSVVAIILFSPLFILIALCIKFNSKGPVFYLQTRVGINGKDFKIFKFRTMKPGSDKLGLLTIGDSDSRVTGVGYFLRKYKIDELPQLFNVLFGTMVLVGPRPEVRKYVNLYSAEQLKVLSVKPGVTDYASIQFSKESELLANATDSEREYVEKILPEKLRLNLKYLEEKSFFGDLKILGTTLVKIVT